MGLPDDLIPETAPAARDEAVVEGAGYRFTVLTPSVIRMEYAANGNFEDRASQRIWYRDHPAPEFDVTKDGDVVEIATNEMTLRYTETAGGFTEDSLSIRIPGDGTEWRYGDVADALGGAVRTVDGLDGGTPLDAGLINPDGWTVIDDSESLVFEDDGWVERRTGNESIEDLYFFAYGDDYRSLLGELVTIAGPVPMIPRWSLGNWWSRYWAYSEADLRDLLTTFQELDIPLSVCVIDMDWHTTDNEYHGGWTGWTWNRELFPDPAGFISWLHDQDLHTGLNIHPADGVHPHEEQYENFADSMGIDPASETPIEFDSSDSTFLEGYFEHVIRPIEERDGVDFWWIDWQQWDECPNLPGLDPLWALNHLHALDRTRNGRRPFILSRWAGIGGQRYPIQFSGDAHITWESLGFQPYLTMSSANVGCGWWSHDIGGHTGGTGDPIQFGELYTRWTQFGALSPVNRIHTTHDAYLDKRPWEFPDTIENLLVDSLQFRHRLIPYLYTMAWRHHRIGIPLIEPLYYSSPQDPAAYTCTSTYLFGTELAAAPYTTPRGQSTNLSRQPVWLPEGEWFDFFDGRRYQDGWHVRYGTLEDIPLYARAGAIVPLGPQASSNTEPPRRLQVTVFPGADNGFELYEDDGKSNGYLGGDYAITPFDLSWEEDRLGLEIGPPEGNRDHIPDSRRYDVAIRGIIEPDRVVAQSPSIIATTEYEEASRTLRIALEPAAVGQSLELCVETNEESLIEHRNHENPRELLERFVAPSGMKESLEQRIRTDPHDPSWLDEFAVGLDRSQLRTLAETYLDVGVERFTTEEFDRIVMWNNSDRDDVYYRYSEREARPVKTEVSGENAPVRGEKIIEIDDRDPFTWEFEFRVGGVVLASYRERG